MSSSLKTSGFADTKRHYPILDGLRGVAALMVVAFHLFEAHAANRFSQVINHGYLAVDFFFVLSGFVIGYAYDDRWNNMSVTEFFKRRLIRLHPMIVVGMIVGAIGFYFQDSPLFPKIHETPLWHMLLIMVVGMTLVPVLPSMDIRGWDEMHPLNGPHGPCFSSTSPISCTASSSGSSPTWHSACWCSSQARCWCNTASPARTAI